MPWAVTAVPWALTAPRALVVVPAVAYFICITAVATLGMKTAHGRGGERGARARQGSTDPATGRPRPGFNVSDVTDVCVGGLAPSLQLLLWSTRRYARLCLRVPFPPSLPVVLLWRPLQTLPQHVLTRPCVVGGTPTRPYNYP